MTLPQVGVTHDVVLYAANNNISPIGLIVEDFSFRMINAPTFIPRMAMGR
jgi:hypothetical protein